MKRSENMNEECPTNDYHLGEPNGKCWGDGHYLCKKCLNYKLDFKNLGQPYIDYMHSRQGEIQFSEIKSI